MRGRCGSGQVTCARWTKKVCHQRRLVALSVVASLRTTAAGYLSVVGRSKDVIIRGGENLFPVTIENTIVRPLVAYFRMRP